MKTNLESEYITKLEELLREISNWLICEPIAPPEDMMQSAAGFNDAIEKVFLENPKLLQPIEAIIEPSTRCTNCENKRGLWSKELTEQGYTGCIIKAYDELDINMAEIKAESVSLGWIKIHLGVLNEQIITRSVTSCKYFKEQL